MTAPLAEERLSRILDLLSVQGPLRTTAITARLGVSGATVRRDLDTLARRGLIRKVHGGAALASQDQQYRDRQELQQTGKRRLAELAVSLIAPGETVYLDAGTTARQLAQALRRTPALTRTLRVVTHGLDVAYELNGECSLYVIGGEVYTSTYSLTGPDALAAIGRYNYDLFFVGCTSIDPSGHLTNSNLPEAGQKTAIMARSRRSVLLADGSKWGHAGFAAFAAFSDLSAWVTDQAPPGAHAAFTAAGVPVLSAETPDAARHAAVLRPAAIP
ncbi:DeoR/GlpR family DNA-binding transcription regulator [uncultured Deinococcus sp.]|uniref:DeoR/GlpR family DNA-binding transcription regulator n=1 Tax=uncultured Deinococcus sp. TaxID=158789 RepID=UPI002586F1AD|nr:DeoR/GlpR family DNA-binding transcription regulator [uncultured Deinococcus sp.]